MKRRSQRRRKQSPPPRPPVPPPPPPRPAPPHHAPVTPPPVSMTRHLVQSELPKKFNLFLISSSPQLACTPRLVSNEGAAHKRPDKPALDERRTRLAAHQLQAAGRQGKASGDAARRVSVRAVAAAPRGRPARRSRSPRAREARSEGAAERLCRARHRRDTPAACVDTFRKFDSRLFASSVSVQLWPSRSPRRRRRAPPRGLPAHRRTCAAAPPEPRLFPPRSSQLRCPQRRRAPSPAPRRPPSTRLLRRRRRTSPLLKARRRTPPLLRRPPSPLLPRLKRSLPLPPAAGNRPSGQ